MTTILFSILPSIQSHTSNTYSFLYHLAKVSKLRPCELIIPILDDKEIQSACQTRHEMFINLEARRANTTSNSTYKESILGASKPVFGELSSVRTRTNAFPRSRMFDYTRTLSLPESNCFPSSHGH
ncbi:hypothetical protein CEXT_531821 [Caerostris extrusa]|uniref:Uncharacterized protein n=1 Tax=Caerostris extrusa TaxID=172846 RepID=A0AAV4MXD3_CAEEX|nr:hypothetical protein CEXT_531821 [Caerostris extrusa]